jgi:hypothetical protein
MVKNGIKFIILFQALRFIFNGNSLNDPTEEVVQSFFMKIDRTYLPICIERVL